MSEPDYGRIIREDDDTLTKMRQEHSKSLGELEAIIAGLRKELNAAHAANVRQSSASELGNLKTAQDVAYRIFAEITVIPADAQAAKVIALTSQFLAQARVDELRVLRASLVEHGDWHEYMIGCGCKFCKDERDLAAIASATKS